MKKALSLVLKAVCLPLAVSMVFLLCGATGTGMASAAAYWLSEIQRQEQLDAYFQQVMRYSADMKAIDAELVEGRLSLRGAVGAIRAEAENEPPGIALFIGRLPGHSVEERYMRWVISRIGNRLRKSSRQGEVLRHLDAELHAWIAEHDHAES
jgi:hypothetical protein